MTAVFDATPFGLATLKIEGATIMYDSQAMNDEKTGEFVLWLMAHGFTVLQAGDWMRWKLARPDTGKKGYRTVFEIYYNKHGRLTFPEHTRKLVQLWRQSLKGHNVDPLK